jgi:hypothetical protein
MLICPFWTLREYSGTLSDITESKMRLLDKKYAVNWGDKMSFQKLVRSCLYNWLGYGNLNGETWFIGTEEGGAEIWRQKTQTLESSLNHRRHFSLSMDFKTVWEDIYGIPLHSFKGPCVWRYMAAYLLSSDGYELNQERINNYVFVEKKLGSSNSNHFMCELLPLPKRSKNDIQDYQSIWKTIKAYHREVIPRRFELIKDTIINNRNVLTIISYESLLSEKLLDYFSKRTNLESQWQYRKERYSLYRIDISNNRQIVLLTTPFFGNGCISYDGLEYTSAMVRDYLRMM